VAWLFAALCVTGVGVLIWSLRGVTLDLPARRRKLVRANLGPRREVVATDLRAVVLSQSPWDRIVQPAIGWLARTGRRLTPAGAVGALERRRALAGMDAHWTAERLLALKVGGGLVGGFLGVTLFLKNPGATGLAALALFTGLGLFAVDVMLDGRARRRQGEIERDFPNVLDQITICVEAGLGLDAAMAHAARTGDGPLAEELTRTLQDLQVGLPRNQALEALAARTDVADVRHFAVAIQQATRYGVPIADALRQQATEARDRRRARAEERAQKMSVKLLFPLIFCILPALFVVLLGPAAIRIAKMGLGGG
jgi:tight adherence protein C